MAWREELHPRDARGRFVHKGAAAAVSLKSTLANPSTASADDLMDVFHRLSSQKKLSVRNLKIIDEELARREGTEDLAPADDTPEQRQVDSLVRRGWDYADAYQEVYGRGGERGEAEQEYATLGPRRGETTEQARRRAYREMVALSALQAEEATRGNLLAKGCENVPVTTLWGAAPARARKCASEELKRWWEQHGRVTYAEFRAQLGGTGVRRARASAALAGAGRDFGV